MTVEARVPVPVPGAPYETVVGTGLLGQLAEHVPWPAHARRVVIVTVAPVRERYAAQVEGSLRAAGFAVDTVCVPDGEAGKTLATLESLYHRFAALPLARDDVVVALGGGVVGDLAGFAAATWNRGVAVVQVPTTLLAQVDAAVGGKTGVNLAEGKNLVGAFHQPLAVVADTAALATLAERERRAGLGEVAKYGFIHDPVILDLLEAQPVQAAAGGEVVTELVVRSVAIKARVVAADERESGERALLNYGHTVGHAIETLTAYATYRHGEAVALGMVFAARLGERLGVSEPGLAARTVALLDALGLPTGGLRLDPGSVWAVLARDKKARAGTDGSHGTQHGVRFVLCRRPGEAFLADPPPGELVEEALATLA